MPSLLTMENDMSDRGKNHWKRALQRERAAAAAHRLKCSHELDADAEQRIREAFESEDGRKAVEAMRREGFRF